jgi:hypothetical protein
MVELKLAFKMGDNVETNNVQIIIYTIVHFNYCRKAEFLLVSEW